MISKKSFLTSLIIAAFLSTTNFVMAQERTVVNEEETLNIHELTLEDINFNGNGGAVENKGSISVKDSNFKNNSAQNGGAIYNTGTISTLDNSVFQGNTIKTSEKVKISTIDGWNYDSASGRFIKNDDEMAYAIPKYSGNKITYMYNDEVIGTVITNGNGGAIYNDSSDLTIENSRFVNNSVDLKSNEYYMFGANYANGGAIYNNGNLTVKNSDFINNKASHHTTYTDYDKYGENTTTTISEYSGTGGAISAAGGDLTIEKSNFENNTAADAGGAVHWQTFEFDNKNNVTVSDSKFYNNKAWSEYRENETITANGQTYYGHEISYGGSGGAISAMNGNVNINNSEFVGNTAAYTGGAIATGEAIIKNSTFKNNSAKSKSDVLVYKYNSETGKVEKDENYSVVKYEGKGGAVHAINDLSVDNTVFENNTSGESGGAITSLSDNTNITNSTFISNSTIGKGGAIEQRDGTINITDTDFINNSASVGGAIYVGNEYFNPEFQEKAKISIKAENKDVTFSGNKADKGADIYAANVDLNLNANEGKKITFDGGITGKNAIININDKTNGKIIFANSVAPDENSTLAINIKGGTVDLTDEKYLNNTDLTLDENSTLNLLNNKVGTMKLNSLTSNNGNVNIDMDLANPEQKFDFFTANNANGTLNITGTNILSDMTEGENSITVNFADLGLSNTLQVMTKSELNTLTNDYLYTIIADGTKAEITRLTDEKGNTAMVDGFTVAVNQTDTVSGKNISLSENRIYSATKNIEITGNNSAKGWSGELGGKSLTVNGNGYTLDGKDNTAILVNDGQTLSFNDTNIKGFKTNDERKGAITVKDGGVLNITAINSNVELGNTVNDVNEKNDIIYLDGSTSKAFLTTSNGKEITVNNNISSANNANELKLSGNGKITFNGIVDPLTLTNENADTVHNNYIDDVTYNLNSGVVTFSKDEYLNGQTNKNTLNFNGGTLNLANGAVGIVDLAALNINANSNIMVDADLAKETMDKITADSATANKDAYLNVSNINLLSDAAKDKVEINSVDPAITLDGGETLASHITTSVTDVAYSSIYKYGVGYDPATGNFTFSRGSNKDYNNINPAVMVSPVAAQLGGYMTMLDTYNNAFANMDLRMLSPSVLRLSSKNANKYAVTELSATQNTYQASEYNSGGMYVRPYAAYDSVGLKNGPKVGNVSYGSFIGGDSAIHSFKNGFEGTFSPYISYQGSHQNYSGNSIYQNSGSLGFTGTLYKGNFFTGLTVGAGMNISEASTMYGSEDFPMLIAGIANKTGYNFEFKEGKFIIQPNLLLSYTFVNAFDYTNGAGVKINSDPLNAIQVAPSVKFVMNTKNGWQPYASFGMMWNIMDDTDFTANNVSLPQLSVKPYFQYGLGVQKTIGDRFTAYGQVMLRNGGRNGIAATFGGKYLLGKEKQTKENI